MTSRLAELDEQIVAESRALEGALRRQRELLEKRREVVRTEYRVAESLSDAVLDLLRVHQPEEFSLADILTEVQDRFPLVRRNTIAATVSRLVRAGQLRRVERGTYVWPT